MKLINIFNKCNNKIISSKRTVTLIKIIRTKSSIKKVKTKAIKSLKMIKKTTKKIITRQFKQKLGRSQTKMSTLPTKLKQ